jgi:hypothetical protein
LSALPIHGTAASIRLMGLALDRRRYRKKLIPNPFLGAM